MSATRGTFNSFEKGEIYVQASLAELDKLERRLQGAAINVQDDIEAAKRQYDRLALQRSALKRHQETTTFNPVKHLEAYKNTRQFHAAAKRLYTLTKATSDNVRRSLILGEPEGISPAADGAVPPGGWISISIPQDGPVDEETAREIWVVADGFVDQTSLTGSSADAFSAYAVDAATLVDPQPADGSLVDAPTLAISQLMNSAFEDDPEASPTNCSSGPQIVYNYYILNRGLCHDSSATNSAAQH